jgi:hypothetical protein
LEVESARLLGPEPGVVAGPVIDVDRWLKTGIGFDRLDLTPLTVCRCESSPHIFRQGCLPLQGLSRIPQSLNEEVILTCLQEKSEDHRQHLWIVDCFVRLKLILFGRFGTDLLYHLLDDFFFRVSQAILDPAVLIDLQRQPIKYTQKQLAF